MSFELTITKDSVVSTDEHFTMDDISGGNAFTPVDVRFKNENGKVTRRSYIKGERKNCNQTLPRLCCQIYEGQIARLSNSEKESFPICERRDGTNISGIFPNVQQCKENNNLGGHTIYHCVNGDTFVFFYDNNIFTHILFVQECLKRWGNDGDTFFLEYREKTNAEKKNTKDDDGSDDNEQDEQSENDESTSSAFATQGSTAAKYINPLSAVLLESKNIVLHGAPGTGKSYLARQIAADIITGGKKKYSELSPDEKEQVEFVQFHPNYDYTDFVEGLRPIKSDDGTMRFELRDGVFKAFVERARKNYEDSKKSKETLEKEISVQEAMQDFFADPKLANEKYKTISGNEFSIADVTDNRIHISIPNNPTTTDITLNADEIRQMLESDKKFSKIKDITTFFGKNFATQQYSYDFVLYKKIQLQMNKQIKRKVSPVPQKPYIFIIDEINRGEISKILGELFFSIDPGYRGIGGEVSTQYANMHTDPSKKFYVPENVYIIGTMNDIDRSVDSFDFAMRRRFRFIAIKASEHIGMLDALGEKKNEAVRRMNALNTEIVNIDDLNENYQIGAAYFLKAGKLGFDKLWTDYLEPLLEDYVNGLPDEKGIMEKFEKAYKLQLSEGETDESAQD